MSEQQQPQASPEGEATSAYSNGEDMNTPMILLIGLIFAVVTFVVIFFLQGVFYRMTRTEHQAKVISERPQELLAIQSAQEERLNSYGWVDRATGIVSIPIERAMELELQQLQNQQPATQAPPPGALAAGQPPASPVHTAPEH